jgi:hypothetical protein
MVMHSVIRMTKSGQREEKTYREGQIEIARGKESRKNATGDEG